MTAEEFLKKHSLSEEDQAFGYVMRVDELIELLDGYAEHRVEKCMLGVSNWVAVEDHLPDKEGHYVVYTPQSFPKNCRSVVAEFYVDGDFKGFYSEAYENFLEDVTHWKDVLEPPCEL